MMGRRWGRTHQYAPASWGSSMRKTPRASKVVHVIAKRAIIYADKQLTSPIGYVKFGTTIRIGDVSRRYGTVVPVGMANKKIGYIKLKDIAADFKHFKETNAATA